MKWLISRVNMVSTSTPARIRPLSKAGRRDAKVAQKVWSTLEIIRRVFVP